MEMLFLLDHSFSFLEGTLPGFDLISCSTCSLSQESDACSGDSVSSLWEAAGWNTIIITAQIINDFLSISQVAPVIPAHERICEGLLVGNVKIQAVDDLVLA